MKHNKNSVLPKQLYGMMGGKDLGGAIGYIKAILCYCNTSPIPISNKVCLKACWANMSCACWREHCVNQSFWVFQGGRGCFGPPSPLGNWLSLYFTCMWDCSPLEFVIAPS